ncbi:MAG: hypothetical protein V4509_05030 [Patescibacteria group bacterium]
MRKIILLDFINIEPGKTPTEKLLHSYNQLRVFNGQEPIQLNGKQMLYYRTRLGKICGAITTWVWRNMLFDLMDRKIIVVNETHVKLWGCEYLITGVNLETGVLHRMQDGRNTVTKPGMGLIEPYVERFSDGLLAVQFVAPRFNLA